MERHGFEESLGHELCAIDAIISALGCYCVYSYSRFNEVQLGETLHTQSFTGPKSCLRPTKATQSAPHDSPHALKEKIQVTLLMLFALSGSKIFGNHENYATLDLPCESTRTKVVTHLHPNPVKWTSPSPGTHYNLVNGSLCQHDLVLLGQGYEPLQAVKSTVNSYNLSVGCMRTQS
ncbi:hypothetical protein E2542_SST14166 [Spatholobus suberectus]|nr:hypothetical protein E2542_SST14166 [Spatholobus suberectus]